MMKDADCFSVEVGHGFCFHTNGRPICYSRWGWDDIEGIAPIIYLKLRTSLMTNAAHSILVSERAFGML